MRSQNLTSDSPAQIGPANQNICSRTNVPLIRSEHLVYNTGMVHSRHLSESEKTMTDRWARIRSQLPEVTEAVGFNRAPHKGTKAICFSCDKPMSRPNLVQIRAEDNPVIRAKEHLCKGCERAYLSGERTFNENTLLYDRVVGFSARRLHG